jgi:hypothetical protein
MVVGTGLTRAAIMRESASSVDTVISDELSDTGAEGMVRDVWIIQCTNAFVSRLYFTGCQLLAVIPLAKGATGLQITVTGCSYIQALWRRVATNKLNVAVAGAMSNMAINIAILKQLQFEIAADFPGYASFDSIIRMVCRGDAETVKGRFHASLHRIGNNEEVTTEVPKIDIDAKECFLIISTLSRRV